VSEQISLSRDVVFHSLQLQNPFRYFNSSPEVIRLVVMMYIRYPLALRQVEDILSERGIDCESACRLTPNRL
jgi:putative transposase